MKKLILAVLAAACSVCLGFAIACTDSEPKYYILTFEDAEGVTYNCEILSGYEVKENATVSFSLSVEENYEGVPVVQANDSVLQASDDGNYSFKMSGDTTVSVTGLFRLNSYLVTFDKGFRTEDDVRDEYRISYNSDFGDTEEGITVEAGATITFTVDVSVYYGDSNFSVLANTTVLPRGNDGVYTLTVTGRTNITVTGLETEESFATRADGGNGTAANPYKISRPIDLFHLSMLVQGFYRNSFFNAYYEFTADIDMKGEQLYIIGDSEENFFAGTVNGNGHTISNYYIADSLIDSENLTTVFYPFIGLFGVVAPTEGGAVPRIYNLNVKNFYMNINASMPTGSSFYVGGIVGAAFGAEITGCSASGVITADADTNYFGYMGGIAGVQYSAFGENNTRIYSVIRSCSSDVDITAESGHVYAAGGIVGAVSTNEAQTTAFVINSYSTGDVTGAMYAGGIAGRISPYSSVQNCYSTGAVEARNTIGMNDENLSLGYAYAGGIVGYADREAIVANCFSAGSAYAWATADGSGERFSYAGDIAGGYEAVSAEYIEAEPALVYNSKKLGGADNAFIKNTLGWNEGDWTFGDGFPVVNTEDADISFKITVDLGGKTVAGKDKIEINVTNTYIPVSYWYLLDDNDMDEFITATDGTRSYGYYFDDEFTLKVPYGFIPMGNTTLYADFANYGEVAGTYHLRGLGGSLKLESDGTLTYRNGALNFESDYTYNGNEIILRNTILAMLVDGENGYYSFKAKLADGELTIYDTTLYPENFPLVAVAEVADFVYGAYYSANNITYTFEKNGTGTVVDESGVTTLTTRFTFAVTPNGVKMMHNDTEYICPVSNGMVVSCMGNTVAKVDAFAGVWEKSAGSHKQYVFDGKGKWSYEYFGYENGEKKVLNTASGTYRYNNDEIILNDGAADVARASFNSHGYLSIDNTEYYKQNSFAGVWNFFSNRDPVELTLNGVSNEGYGVATLDYGNEYAPFGENDIITYSARVNAAGDAVITLYIQNEVLGTLTYSTKDNTLAGSVYLARTGTVENGATFYLYDDFRGVWISEAVGLEVIEFNGLGNYDVRGNAQQMAVSGSITVNGEITGSYTLENFTLTGKFSFGGNDYTVRFDEAANKIIVNEDGAGEFTFEGRDVWYGVNLKTANGDIYSFDGRGNLTNGGTLSVNDSAAYTYKINGTVIDIKDLTNGGLLGNIAVVGDDYKLTLNGNPETLNIANPFTGKWLIAGTEDYLEISEFNANREATGTEFGHATTFTYYPEGNYVTFVSNGEGGAITMYINVMEADGVIELAVASVNNTYGSYSVCLKDDADLYDEYKGEYTGKDGGRFVFDGLGGHKFVNGVATLKSASGDEDDISYAYVINSFGMPELTSDAGALRLFVPCGADDEDAFTSGGKHYKLVIPDALYNLSAKIYKTANGTIDMDTTYTFDGVSKVYCSDGAAYSYEIETNDAVKMEMTLVLTGTDEKRYKAVLDYSDIYWTFYMNEIDELYGVIAYPMKDGLIGQVSYSFDGMNGVKDLNGTVYSYVINSNDTENKQYSLTLTDEDGKKYNAVLDYSQEDKTITVTEVTE